MRPLEALTDHVTLVPEGRFCTANCWDPDAPRVTVAGLTLEGAVGCAGAGTLETERLIVADALWVASARLVAVTVTFWVAVIVAGAVYKPFASEPILGLSDHVTPVLELPLTVAVNCFDRPAASEVELGFSEMLTAVVVGALTAGVATAGPSMIVALAIFVESARLVAEMVTRESEATELGAEYSPLLEIEPRPWTTAHCTWWFKLPVTEAVNCSVWPPQT